MWDDDLRTELQFHIDLRVESYVKAGMAAEEAEALARKEFGDMEAAMNGMRLARVRSRRMALIALAFTSLWVAGLWLFGASTRNAPVVFPQLPVIPLEVKIEKRPPPPPPGPTWEEFVAKVNTFGDGSHAKSRRR